LRVIAQPIPVDHEHPFKPMRFQQSSSSENVRSNSNFYRQKPKQSNFKRRGPLVNV